MVIQIDGLSIDILRKPIKNMYLRVNNATGDVSVTAPMKMALRVIESQLETKRAWIHRARARVMAREASSLLMEHGEIHHFMGNPYALVIHADAPLKEIAINGDFLHGFCESHAPEVRKIRLQAWYRSQMQALIPGLIQKWEPIIGVSVYAWGIKSMKTRWGSCNVVAHRIWLNLNLIQKPLICLEYVLVHEMVHLLEANHSKRFHALMTKFLPNWPDCKRILESGALLNHKV